ncbi:FAD binding domain-containing protein [Ilyonectria destructans]|nr:FAD binding domain-containing protein [Ilyonectria destructans]
MNGHTTENIDVPVVIVGGGGCGLCLSIFLSDYGIEHYVFEKHPGTAILPRAHYINQRSMEILRQHNISEALKSVGCPIRNMSQTDWRTSLGGDGPYDGRVICSVPAFGGSLGSPDYEIYRSHGPEISSNLPLVRAEPIFRKIAEERNPGRVRFSHRVIDFVEDKDHVLVTVEGPDGKVEVIRTLYLVGADGGKFVGPKIGAQMEGPRNLVEFLSIYFRANLSEYCDDRTLITHFINPEGEKMERFDCGALVKMGPTWDRRCEEWILHFGVPVDENLPLEAETLASRGRQLLKIPDLKMDVIKVSRWVLERTLVSKYQDGRIFLAGDAAHKRPPTTGLGLNTAIEDSLNLAWKLSFVLSGKADASLLNTYEAERRPVGKRNCDWGLFAFSNYPVLQASVGFLPGQKKYNQERLARFFEDSPSGETARHHLSRIFETQDIEFSAHNIELGFSYDSESVAQDGSAKPREDPGGRVYVPTTRPGHRLPHAWVERDHQTVSTHDLIGNGGDYDLLLISDELGDHWSNAARNITARSAIRIAVAGIKAHRHCQKPGLYQDCDDNWIKVRGFADGGAILVRPDNFIMWRSMGPSSQNGEELVEILRKVLKYSDTQESVSSMKGGAISW